MCVELHFSGGTLTEDQDFRIDNLKNPRRFWKMCQDIGFPCLDMQIKLNGKKSVIVQNSRNFHQPKGKQFVVHLKRPIPKKLLDELQRVINGSDAKLDITGRNDSPQNDNLSTHRMSKSRMRR